jgi:hypothetical protein
VAERVLTLRELNRATLARQLLLERKRLSPTAVIERLVGMQAQWPPAPYVGLWTRTTSFRREALERELERATVVKATVMRQTLHLVTRRDYALLRAAMSETNFPWESSQAKLLAPSVRPLAGDGPVTTVEALAHLEREHGLTGVKARRAWRGARVRVHLVHHPETALWHARPRGRFVALDEPKKHDPTEARAEILRRYLAAFGPASRRDIVAWSMMHVPEIQRALDRLEPLRRFRDEHGRHQHERRRRTDVPRRRVRRGRLARRERARRARAVRDAGTLGTTRARGRGRASGSVPRRLTHLGAHVSVPVVGRGSLPIRSDRDFYRAA